MLFHGMAPHWVKRGTLSEAVVFIPETLPGKTGGPSYLEATMGGGLPGYDAHTQLISDMVYVDDSCGLEDFTLTPTADERKFRQNTLDINGFYVVDSESEELPPPRETRHSVYTMDVVASETFGWEQEISEDTTGNGFLELSYPDAVSGTLIENEPRSFTIGTVTTNCTDGTDELSDEVGRGWFKGRIDDIFSGFSSLVTTELESGRGLGSGGPLSKLSESTRRHSFYYTGKLMSFAWAYDEESRAQAWNDNYYHALTYERRELAPRLYANPSMFPMDGGAQPGHFEGLDFYHEDEIAEVLTNEITNRRIDSYGTYDINDDYLAAIPYKVLDSINPSFGVWLGEDGYAVTEHFFLSVTGKRYRLHIRDASETETSFIEVPESGLSAPWDGMVETEPFYQFYKYEEWIEDAWVEIPSLLLAGEITYSDPETGETGAADVLSFGRARGGARYGHLGMVAYRGGEDDGSRYATKTITRTATPRVDGVSGDLFAEWIEAYDANGVLLPEQHTAEADVNGVIWLDETNGLGKVSALWSYGTITVDTNTEVRSVSSSRPVTFDPSVQTAVPWIIRAAGVASPLRLVETVTQKLAVTAHTYDVDETEASVPLMARSAVVSPPMTAEAGQIVVVDRMGVTRHE